MRFVNEPHARKSLGLVSSSSVSAVSVGPSNGHTRGVLSISTSSALACHFLAWFTSSIGLFLLPLLLLGIAVSRCNTTQLVIGHDPKMVGLGVSLVSIYWGIAVLVLGTHSVYTQCTTALRAPRTNCCSPVVRSSSDFLSDHSMDLETSLACFLHAERPDAEVFW